MSQFLNQHKQNITRIVLFAFVMSWFSLIGQASAHSFMMLEMQQMKVQHQAMGHDISAHCQPVLCESVISLDDQTQYGLDSVQMIDLNAVPAMAAIRIDAPQIEGPAITARASTEYDPPPLQRSGILRI